MKQESLVCRYQFSIDDPTISYRIDHVYIIPEDYIDEVMPLKGFVMNSGFELNQDSVYSPLSNWNFRQLA